MKYVFLILLLTLCREISNAQPSTAFHTEWSFWAAAGTPGAHDLADRFLAQDSGRPSSLICETASFGAKILHLIASTLKS
jgi:hypothetical protein